MMKKILCVLFVLVTASSAFAAEFSEGRVKLVINEHTGRFSLYYMADLAAEEYLPFFVDEDPRTSFLSLTAHNRTYKMGESSFFRTSLGGTPAAPALVFESSFLTVTEQFSFIKTGAAAEANGVMITITLANKSETAVEAGVRFLVDTVLGEKDPPHFSTNLRTIDAETGVDAASADRYWISRNKRLSLVGSISGEAFTAPDAVLFCNWKRLNDSAWKPRTASGQNFNFLPYSIDDSAVCYFYEPERIERGASRSVSLTLSGGDGNFSAEAPRAAAETPVEALVSDAEKAAREDSAGSMRADLTVLRDLLALLEGYASSKFPVSAEELDAASLLISGIKSKYSIP